MAMRYNKVHVFCGAASALVLMTLISCIFGAVVYTLLPILYTQLLAMVLFFFFGV
jgi:putative Ca2+/H+ antiporter (TMEM165/GDT1 family)